MYLMLQQPCLYKIATVKVS